MLRATLVRIIAIVTFVAAPSAHATETIRIAIGTQDTTINCATGGLIIRELKLLEKYLPHDGRYRDVKYDISWKNFTAGAPLTSEMVAHKLDIGAMADFPSVLNGVAFQKQGERSVFISTLSASVTGGGNGIRGPDRLAGAEPARAQGQADLGALRLDGARHAPARDPRSGLGPRAATW